MDLGLTYKALAKPEVDVIAGNSTDGLIESLTSLHWKTIGTTSRRTMRFRCCEMRLPENIRSPSGFAALAGKISEQTCVAETR